MGIFDSAGGDGRCAEKISGQQHYDAGMLVRAVGNGEQFPAERTKAAANMEDVYLYRMEADIG